MRLPFNERRKLACQAWAIQGYGTPLAVYVLYALKIVFYIGMWLYFCSFAAPTSDPAWWCSRDAFTRAVLWTMAFECIGLGCGSGPLTGRYLPPIGGLLYFARPGTTRLAPAPFIPGTSGHQRTWIDVAMYIAHLGFLVRALTSSTLSSSLLWPTILLLPFMGLRDKTVFLANRPEHYYTTLLCLLAGPDWIPGSKAVLIAIWCWAGIAKLNHHFPTVVAVMTSNSPFMAHTGLRKAMYRDYPTDLRPSTLAKGIAHGGAFVELGFPALLLLGDPFTPVGLGLMVLFHIYIVSCVPLAVPIEWNFFMVYAALVLFGVHGGGLGHIAAPPLALLLLIILVAIPLYGHLKPDRVSFLIAMRYYAGNWPFSVWLFRGEASQRLDEKLTKASATIPKQLRLFYEDPIIHAALGKVAAFRTMHLQGRVLHDVIPKAVANIEDYEYLDGELITGLTLGWNFGDGHLGQQGLLDAVQAQCQFDEGELRCVFVQPQPLFGTTMTWRIVDARTGVIDEGETPISALLTRQPWPT